MTENVPPNANTTSQADQPGRPYYESLRSTLRQTLDKKRKLDEQLTAIEDQIFKAESTYLEDTASSGNIVRGFDGWVKGVQVGGGRGDDRRRGRVREDDRIFSRSSVSWMRLQEGSDSATTSHAATPTGSFAGHAPTREGSGQPSVSGTTKSTNNKKKRPTEKDDEGDGKAAKRNKVSYSRD